MPTFQSQVSTWNTTAGSHAASHATVAVGDLFIVVSGYTAGTPSSGSVSDDQGGAYVKVAGAVYNTSIHTIEIFVRTALAASTATHVITQADPPGSDSGGGLTALRFSGFNVGGGDTFVQAKALNNQTVDGIPAVTFGAAAATGNVTVGAVMHSLNSSTTFTAPTSWTERFENGFTSPAASAEVVTRDSGFTGTTITWAAGSATQPWCALIAEFRADRIVVPDYVTARSIF